MELPAIKRAERIVDFVITRVKELYPFLILKEGEGNSIFWTLLVFDDIFEIRYNESTQRILYSINRKVHSSISLNSLEDEPEDIMMARYLSNKIEMTIIKRLQDSRENRVILMLLRGQLDEKWTFQQVPPDRREWNYFIYPEWSFNDFNERGFSDFNAYPKTAHIELRVVFSIHGPMRVGVDLDRNIIFVSHITK